MRTIRTTTISCLLINPHDTLHHGKRVANKVDAQCNKPVTELS